MLHNPSRQEHTLQCGELARSISTKTVFNSRLPSCVRLATSIHPINKMRHCLCQRRRRLSTVATSVAVDYAPQRSCTTDVSLPHRCPPIPCTVRYNDVDGYCRAPMPTRTCGNHPYQERRAADPRMQFTAASLRSIGSRRRDLATSQAFPVLFQTEARSMAESPRTISSPAPLWA